MSARLQERAIGIAVAVMAALCALALIRVAEIVPLHVPLDPNEGWNAYHAEAAIHGHGLYPRPLAMMVNNYPPLFFYLDGGLGRVVGDDIVAGRLLSLVSAVAIAIGIALAALRLSAAPLEAAFGALFFLASLLVQSDYVGMSDPQLLGHALQTCALVLALKPPRRFLSLAAAALMASLAFFIKHNLIILPLALTIWLAIVDRASAIKLAASGMACLACGLVAFKLVFGIGLLEQLYTARVYSLTLLSANLSAWLAIDGLPLLVVTACLAALRRAPFALFCAIYLTVSVAAGALFSGGAGVDVNAMFDAFIALALSSALILTHLRASPIRAVIAAAVALPLLAGLAESFNAEWLAQGYWLDPLAAERRDAAADIAFLRGRSGPVLCEMLSLCYWAGKPAQVDVFNLGQQYLTHTRSDADLAELLGHRFFAAVQLDPAEPFPLTARIEDTLGRRYRIDHANEGDGVFYVPR